MGTYLANRKGVPSAIQERWISRVAALRLFALRDARDWTVFIRADEDADGSIHCMHQPLGTADAPLGDAHTINVRQRTYT
jgi:hypothetical protein